MGFVEAPQDGQLRKAWAFVMTFGWSGHQYVEFVFEAWPRMGEKGVAPYRAKALGSLCREHLDYYRARIDKPSPRGESPLRHPGRGTAPQPQLPARSKPSSRPPTVIR